MSTLQTYTAPRARKKLVFTSSTSFAAIFAAATGLVMIGADQAQAQDQCSSYTVARGDTLSAIASAADVRGGYQFLFNANRNVLDSPNRLEVGQVLQIPCADGSLPTTAAAPVVAASTAPAPTTSEPDRPIRIATASGYAPFTDEGLPGGGMITQMVDRSMQLGNADQDYSIIFINDWGSHLETLLPSGAIDMVFPWFKPNCDRVENLSPSSAYRCTEFNHSEPFYEVLVDFYTLNGSPYATADSYDDLKGSRICRPEAWFTFDLEAEQLTAPNVEYITTVAQNGCWQKLVDGEVDIVTYDALPAEEDARNAGLIDQITTLSALQSTVTTHIFVSKNNAYANEALPIINAGLEELRLSGEWFTIVREAIKTTVEN